MLEAVEPATQELVERRAERPVVQVVAPESEELLAVREAAEDLVAALGAHTPLTQQAHVALAHLADALTEARARGDRVAGDTSWG